MAHIELSMPRMGESVAEATIIRWLKNEGDMVAMDEALLEIATDKVDSDVPSTVQGRLVKKLFSEEDVVKIGEVLAIIDTGAGTEAPAAPVQSTPEVQNPGDRTQEGPVSPSPEPAAIQQIPGFQELNGQSHGSFQVSSSDADRFYSPLVKSIAHSEGISKTELDQIKGSGGDGRVTKQDIITYLNLKKGGLKWDENHLAEPVLANELPKSHAATGAPADSPNPEVRSINHQEARKVEPTAKPEKAIAATDDRDNFQAYNFEPGDEIIEMDRMRRLIADHMLHSKEISAHVTSFVEADVSNLVAWRERIKEGFKKREGEGITFTPIFIEAVARVLKELPMVNVSVKDRQIILHKHINIGMAAALPSGNLIVPVVRDADQKNLVGLAKQVNDLARRARAGKLSADEISGGTFTITNLGSFGNIMGTPIINQPQVAILATGAIQKKPAVVETEIGDVIAIRHKMYLSLSYDHRVVDGALGGLFLKKVADYLEAFDPSREV